MGLTVGLTFDAARGGRKPGAGAMALLGEGWRMVRAVPQPFLGALSLGNVIFFCASERMSRWAIEALKAPVAHWSFEILKEGVAALLTAFALRVLLAPASRWWRLDRSLARGVAALTLASLAVTVMGFLGRFMHGPSATVLNELALQIPTWTVCASLMLWPVGLLIEDPEMSPQRSIALMRGNVRAYVVAYLLLLGGLIAGMAIVAVPALFLHIKPADYAHELWLPIGLVLGAFAIAEAALWAALYQTRTRPVDAGPLSF